MRDLDVTRLQTVGYQHAWDLQTRLHEQRVLGSIGDTLLLLEHEHVYTIGRRGSHEEVLWDDDALRARGVDVVETDRGGQVTYHGPGQLVGYPIIDLGRGGDLGAYLRRIEEVLIRTLGAWGLSAARDAAGTGVWVDGAKIAAIGVRVARGVTKHGFALNVSTDLSFFAGIVPCGITDRGVTSMAAVLGSAPSVDEVAIVLAREFAEGFGYSRAEAAS